MARKKERKVTSIEFDPNYFGCFPTKGKKREREAGNICLSNVSINILR